MGNMGAARLIESLGTKVSHILGGQLGILELPCGFLTDGFRFDCWRLMGLSVAFHKIGRWMPV